MNQIKEHRKIMNRYLKSIQFMNSETIFPENKLLNYYVIKENYKSEKSKNPILLSKILVKKFNNTLIEIFIEELYFFHNWVHINDIDYLFFAEKLHGGISLLNLQTGAIYSYCDSEDGFINTKYTVSPNSDKIAIEGFYWGCLPEIKICDFTKPLILPYPSIKQLNLKNKGDTFIRWIDNNTVELGDTDMKTFNILKTREYKV